MTLEMWITLGILFAAIVLFVTEWLRVDVVAIGVVIALMLTGILGTSEAIAGFSSSSVILIASLFIVGGAVFQTGLAAMIGERIMKIAGTNEIRLIITVMIAVAVLSGFMSNTGVVAVMLPAIISLAVVTKMNPSKLLIPLAFGSSLGGAATLIGTPPNIILNEVLEDAIASGADVELFGFFSFTPLAILLTIAGIAFMVFAGRRLLPDRKPKREEQQVETPKELFNIYKLPDNLFRMRVRSKSPLIGQKLEVSELGQDFEVNVLEIRRPSEPTTVASFGNQKIMLQSNAEHIHPTPDTILAQDDVLIVRGEGNDVGRAAAYWNFAIQPSEDTDQEALLSHEVGIAEVVLPPRSALIGKTLVETSFGRTYRLTVLDIRRPGNEGRLSVKESRLEFGDTLLVQGEWKDIFALKRRRHDFVVLGATEAMQSPQNRKKAPIAALVLVGMMVVMVTNIIPFTTASMIAALLVVLFGCLTMDEAYEAIDWKSIVLIAGMLPMSTALEKVGLVELVATGFIETLGSYGSVAVMGALFALTAVLTQVLSNTATTVLLAPIGLAIAQALGVQPYSFLMTVAVAASMAFASPVASPVNTLVMGAGNYRFADYVKIGIPLIILTMIISIIVLPILFPL